MVEFHHVNSFVCGITHRVVYGKPCVSSIFYAVCITAGEIEFESNEAHGCGAYGILRWIVLLRFVIDNLKSVFLLWSRLQNLTNFPEAPLLELKKL